MKSATTLNSAVRKLSVMALSAAAALLSAGCETKPRAKLGQALPKVVVTNVRRATLPIVAVSNGVTRAMEDVMIRARVTGFLKEKHFKEGADVKKDQLLLVIDEEPFRIKLSAANAALAEAQSSLRKAEKSKSREMAKAQLALDEAQANLARVELERERNLYQRKATPLEEVDRKDALQKRSAAQVDYSKAALEQALADYDIAIASAQASVDKANSAVRDAEIELGYCRMVSPIDGRIGELKVKIGNLVQSNPATELVSIRQLDPMAFELHPSSRYLPRIAELSGKGIKVNLIVRGDSLHPHPGRVTFIDNTVDTATATVMLKAEVANPDKSLLPGEYIKTSTVVGEYKDTLVVPEKAVFEGQDGSAVYVVDDKGIVDRVRVVTPDAVDGFKVVESGLTEGQKVIVEGIQLVRKGAKVETETKEYAPTSAAPVDPGTIRSEGADEPAKQGSAPEKPKGK